MPAARAGRAEQHAGQRPREIRHRRTGRRSLLRLRGGVAASLCGRGAAFRERSCRQLLVRRLAIDGLFVLPVHRLPALANLIAGGVRDGANLRTRGHHPRAPGDLRRAFRIERRDERLADRQLHDRLLDVHLRVRPQRLRGRLHRLLIPGRERAQRVLDAVAELAENVVRDVGGALRHEVHADALRANQPDDLLDLLDERRGRVVEEQMRLVEEEDERRFFGIADLRQVLEQLRQHPQEKRRVQLRLTHQLVGDEDVDNAPAFRIGLEEIVDVEHRLAEEPLAALLLDLEERPLDGADRRGGHVAVVGGELLGVVADELEHRAQILQIQQQHAVVVGHLEHERQHALLGRVQVEQPAEQQRTDVGDGRADGEAALAEHVPERHRVRAPRGLGDAGRGEPLLELGRCRPGRGHAREIAFDVGQEHGNAELREMVGEDLKADRLAGAGGAGDQPVPVAHARDERDVVAVGGPRDDEWLGHGRHRSRSKRERGQCRVARPARSELASDDLDGVGLPLAERSVLHVHGQRREGDGFLTVQ